MRQIAAATDEPRPRDDAGAAFEPQRVAQAAESRVRVALVTGMLAAGIAVAALSSSPAPSATEAVPATGALVAAIAPTAPPPATGLVSVRPPPHGAGVAGVAPVRLALPAAGQGAITGQTIEVSGVLRVHAASLRISLESSERQSVASAIVDTSNRDGGIRPVRTPSFDVALQVPPAMPAGRAWVVVTAYDVFGAPLGAYRRAVEIG